MKGIECKCPTITHSAEGITIDYGTGVTVKIGQDKITWLLDNEEVAYFTDKSLEFAKYDAIPQLVFRMQYARLLEDVQRYDKEHIVNAGEVIVPTEDLKGLLDKHGRLKGGLINLNE